ncbi:B12-binding domain-containing protein [Acetobacterium wieringae]|uniref:B12-binding domain-containing protein n=1 Tax=Acetobacterium wieringae TaxID=52694 RepID=UPI00203463A9|nr:B12-binding domain-containing protein [Acetobacterium wieringae]URN85662.1 B12-binding domain-containing protein [Acetobacterium wieringae]
MKEKLIELIADLKLNEAEELADQLIKEGIAVQELYDLVMEGLAEIGKKYENGECYIADLIVSGMIAKNIFGGESQAGDRSSRQIAGHGSVWNDF